jgi:hypothetical protein
MFELGMFFLMLIDGSLKPFRQLRFDPSLSVFAAETSVIGVDEIGKW